MTLETNKRIVQQIWDELVNNRRLDAIEEFVSPDFLDHTPLPGMAAGIEGFRQRLIVLHAAFPDFHSTIDQFIAEGDRVVAMITSTGTHQGDFVGVAATGRRFCIQEMHVLRIANGRMAEHSGIPDFFGLLEQLGLVAAPWHAAASA